MRNHYVKVMGKTEKALIQSVSESELQEHRLSVDHYGVKRPYTFEHKTPDRGTESVTAVALVTLSRPLRRKQRCRRARQIRQCLATLQVIATERPKVRKYKRKTYAEDQIRKWRPRLYHRNTFSTESGHVGSQFMSIIQRDYWS